MTTERLHTARELARQALQLARSGAPTETVVERLARADMEVDDPRAELHVDLLRWRGSIHRDAGETDIAERLYLESRATAREISYAAGEAHAVNCMATVEQCRGRLENAHRLYLIAEGLAAEQRDESLARQIAQNRGIVAAIRGDVQRAIDTFAEIADQAADDAELLARALSNRGLVQTRVGQYEDAGQSFRSALDAATASADLLIVGVVEMNRANLYVVTDRLPFAEDCCTRALRIAERRGDALRRAEVLKMMAAIRRRMGARGVARKLLTEARLLALMTQDELLQAQVEDEMGELSLTESDLPAARLLWDQALARYRKMGAVADAAVLQHKLLAIEHTRHSSGGTELRL